jgi:hypothetical protein
MIDITEDNVRYWWMQTCKQEYETDEDPWVSAVTYLQRQLNVVVHSYIDKRRRFFCWYFPKLINIELENVTEVYIDSTHGTNGQNAELFGIIACEDGYGVPIGYMLMEKKPTEDAELYPGEVIEACTQFFFHARELGLKPLVVHTDKSAAEIAAVKVFTYNYHVLTLACQDAAGWPNAIISLCSWHVEKDIHERLSSRTAEKVHNRTTHAWSLFENDAELRFIDVRYNSKCPCTY